MSKAGRPRKDDIVNPTKEEKIKDDKKNYMRGYQKDIKTEIQKLETAEQTCLKELKKIIAQKKALVKESVDSIMELRTKHKKEKLQLINESVNTIMDMKNKKLT